MIQAAKMLSKSLNLPVVISNVSNQYDIFTGFQKVLTAGPMEFLSLIKHAKFVYVSSFHGTVFSILFHKPFFAWNGMSDHRISTLLERVGLINRALTAENSAQQIAEAYAVDYVPVEERLRHFRAEGIDFLRKALDVD